MSSKHIVHVMNRRRVIIDTETLDANLRVEAVVEFQQLYYNKVTLRIFTGNSVLFGRITLYTVRAISIIVYAWNPRVITPDDNNGQKSNRSIIIIIRVEK